MDSFEWNKIIGAVLFALLVTFGLSMFSGILFSTETPKSPGYVVAVAEQPAEGAKAGAAAAPQPIAVLLASADPKAGESTAKKCGACHTFGEGESPKVGPNLWGVVGRPIASTQFSYSDAMRAHAKEAQTWTYDNLNVFIQNPKGVVPGTKMAFAGLKDDPERANVIAYLRTLAATPLPLPAPPAAAPAAAPAQAGAGQPAAGSAQPNAAAQGGTAQQGQAGAGQQGQAAVGGNKPAGSAGSAPVAQGAQEGGTSPQIQQPQGTLGPLQSTTADQQGAVPQVAPIEQPTPEPPANQPLPNHQPGAPADGKPAQPAAAPQAQATQPAPPTGPKPPAIQPQQVAPSPVQAPAAPAGQSAPGAAPAGQSAPGAAPAGQSAPAAAPAGQSAVPAAAQPVVSTPAVVEPESPGPAPSAAPAAPAAAASVPTAPAQPAASAPSAPAASPAAPAPAASSTPAAAPPTAPAAATPAAPTPTPSPAAAAPAETAVPANSAPAATPAPAAPSAPAAPTAPQQSGDAGAPAQPAAAAAQSAVGAAAASPFVALVAAADPASGQNVAKKCQICHDVSKAAANRIGPHLWGVVDRPVATVPDFAYSQAMLAFSAGGTKKWTYDELGVYLENPKAHVPGTKMAFAGLPDQNQRAQLVAFLRTLSDSPAPLPGAK